MNQFDRSDATALVLAGGASSRMGQPKPRLPFAGEPLLARVVGRLAPLVREVVVASSSQASLPPLPPEVRVIEDEESGLGPLAGLVYGLRAARFEVTLVCGGDHPFPEPALARRLLEAAAGHELVVPRWKGHLQPLFSACRRSVLSRLEERTAAGRLGLVAAIEALGPLEIPEDEVALLDPEGRSFLDLDDPADVERALRLAGS